jgi:hypothetical protein
MGALSWSHDRSPNRWHGRLRIHPGCYCGLSQEAKEHIDTLAGGTFFMLNAKDARALFEKLSASKRVSEVHGLKANSYTVEIDPLIRKF